MFMFAYIYSYYMHMYCVSTYIDIHIYIYVCIAATRLTSRGVNSGISSCQHCWPRALALLGIVQLDAVSYNAAAAAVGQRHFWSKAIGLLQTCTAQGGAERSPTGARPKKKPGENT